MMKILAILALLLPLQTQAQPAPSCGQAIDQGLWEPPSIGHAEYLGFVIHEDNNFVSIHMGVSHIGRQELPRLLSYVGTFCTFYPALPLTTAVHVVYTMLRTYSARESSGTPAP